VGGVLAVDTRGARSCREILYHSTIKDLVGTCIMLSNRGTSSAATVSPNLISKRYALDLHGFINAWEKNKKKGDQLRFQGLSGLFSTIIGVFYRYNGFDSDYHCGKGVQFSKIIKPNSREGSG